MSLKDKTNRIFGKYDIVFPVIIFLFCFINVNKGLDITDAGYNLGNFTYLKGLDGMWYYSTLLANFAGWLIVRLPFGRYMLAVSIYLRIIRGIFAVCLYRFFTKRVKMGKMVSFVGIILSLALCWAPAYGVYHYMTYFLFAIAAMLLYMGLSAESESGKRKYLILAGVVLALNVFVRFPNVCEMALIIAVWWYCIISKEKFGEIINKTLLCAFGYVGTLAAVFTVIAVTGHMGDYIQAIKDLFSMTDESERYGIRFTIRNLIDSYTCVWYWLIPIAIGFAGLIVMGVLFCKLKNKSVKHNWMLAAGNAVAVAGISVIYCWFYKTELFDYNFRSYSSMYLFSVVILIVCLALMVYGLFSKTFDDLEKMLFAAAVVITMITPLGSNNSIYAVINSLFLLFPLALHVSVKFWKKEKTLYLGTGIVALMGFYIVQMILFGCFFTFREKQPAQDTKVLGNKTITGMETTEDNARLLFDVKDILDKNGLNEAKILTFGDVPGFAYYMGLKPALSSTWSSLPSYSAEKFAGQLKGLEGMIAEKGEKVVVITDSYLDEAGKKQDILKEFLKKYNYKEVYSEQGYIVWLTE
ncbi:MAG: hypothetical protein MJ107_00575 [Lachnospiraceae bacterium]|nr:hypothetical protein [Lachnospiraceae bacterium]